MTRNTIPGVEADIADLFQEAMASLASGVAVITTRGIDGAPCGLAATSVASYSADPPSLIASIAHSSRCHAALTTCGRFGVHILRAEDEPIARTFVDKRDDKFADLDWRWDEDVPELGRALAYLRCRRADSVSRYDHTVLFGDIDGGWLREGEPLLYARRRMDWLLHPNRD